MEGSHALVCDWFAEADLLSGTRKLNAQCIKMSAVGSERSACTAWEQKQDKTMSRITTGETLLTGWIRVMPVIIVYWFYLLHPVASESNLNLALGKSAYMSSTSPNHPANKAVDGNLMTSVEHCAQTRVGLPSMAYWYVDLGNTYRVTSVRITMRTSCCDSLLETATIYVSKNLYSLPKPNVYKTTEKCRDIRDINSGGLRRGVTTTIECASPKDGQFVYIQNRGYIQMSLCEVQVYRMQEFTSSARSTVTTSRTRSPLNIGKTVWTGHYYISRQRNQFTSTPLSARESFGAKTGFTTSLPMKIVTIYSPVWMGLSIFLLVVVIILIVTIAVLVKSLRMAKTPTFAVPAHDVHCNNGMQTENMTFSVDYEDVHQRSNVAAQLHGGNGSREEGSELDNILKSTPNTEHKLTTPSSPLYKNVTISYEIGPTERQDINQYEHLRHTDAGASEEVTNTYSPLSFGK